MSRPVLNGLDLNAKNITNMADGVSATDAVTLQQLQGQIAGLNWKQRVRAASTANITVASALVNGLSMDGVTLATGDRVLLKNQTTATENGIYVVVASGAASRSTDADSSAEVRNLIVGVEQGTAAGDTIWQLITDNPTLGSTSLSFTQFSSGGITQAYQTAQAAGSGLTQRSIINFLAGMTAVDNAGSTRTDVGVDNSIYARKFSADCVVTTNPQSFTHSLGTKDVVVQVRRNSDDVLVEADVVSTSTTAISVNFGGAPTAAQYRVTVIG